MLLLRLFIPFVELSRGLLVIAGVNRVDLGLPFVELFPIITTTSAVGLGFSMMVGSF